MSPSLWREVAHDRRVRQLGEQLRFAHEALAMLGRGLVAQDLDRGIAAGHPVARAIDRAHAAAAASCSISKRSATTSPTWSTASMVPHRHGSPTSRLVPS